MSGKLSQGAIAPNLFAAFMLGSSYASAAPALDADQNVEPLTNTQRIVVSPPGQDNLSRLAFNGNALRPTPVSGTQYTYDPANEVDVELVLAVDISQSMDTEEQEVQRAGYVAALTSREFLDAIHVGPIGRIAVTYMEWGGVDEHFIVADWMIVQDEESANHFASKIAEAPLRQVQRTSIASALEKSVELVQNNQYVGLRRVIDISGDGPNNQGGSVTDMRDLMVAQGVTINGLPLMMKSNKNTWQAMLNLDHYYEDCVIGGPGSFAIPVRSQEGFADAIRMKLVMEIAGLHMPEPDAYFQRASGREPIKCNLFD